MRYCPNCGEGGEDVLECHECGAIKCEDCATRLEVMHQHCTECDAHVSELVRLINKMDRLALQYTVDVGPIDALAFARTCTVCGTVTTDDLVHLIGRINMLIPPMQLNEGNPNNGKPRHRFRVGNSGGRYIEVRVTPAYLDAGARRHMLANWEDGLTHYARDAHADDFGISTEGVVPDDTDIFAYYFWWC